MLAQGNKVSPAEALSDGKVFIAILIVSLKACLKKIYLLNWRFSLIIWILRWFEKLSMIPWTLSALTLTFDDQINKLSEQVTVTYYSKLAPYRPMSPLVTLFIILVFPYFTKK